MSRFILGDCRHVLATMPDNSIDFILTDPPYLVNYIDRSGRAIANDVNDDWLNPVTLEMYRVLKDNALCVSFYGWTKVDRFFAAWRAAGFRPVGHIVFAKTYTSKTNFVGYAHESAFVLAKGKPAVPENPISDVQPWVYSGNKHHPTEKPVGNLKSLIESFTKERDIVVDPFAGSGSTCVAAALCNRRYIGVELLPEYHGAAVRRLSAVSAMTMEHAKAA